MQSGGSHPEAQKIEHSNFGEAMHLAYSYPLPVVCFPLLHEVPFHQQMQLLTWLEMYSGKHRILMTTLNEQALLPTIRSRSLIFRDIPKEQLSEEDRQASYYQIKALFEGKARPDEWVPEDHEIIARRLFSLLVEENQNRLQTPPRRAFQVGQPELATLTKLLSRYLENPRIHNLPLLLRSFSTLSLLNIR